MPVLYDTNTPRGGLQSAIDYLSAIVDSLEEEEDVTTLAVHLRDMVAGMKQLEADMGWARDYSDTCPYPCRHEPPCYDEDE